MCPVGMSLINYGNIGQVNSKFRILTKHGRDMAPIKQILKVNWIYFFLGFLLLNKSPITATDGEAFAEAIIRKHVMPLLEERQLPGMAVAVTLNQHGYIFCYGVANKERMNPITPETIFEIGSVTKVFTSTDLALQIVKRRMALHDSIVQYMPALQEGGPIKNVTLLELATHTSSLPRVPPKKWKNQKFTREEIIRFLKNWQPEFPIGSRYLYSNLGFGLLGFALENLEEKPYQEVIEKDICRPLQMTSTYTHVPDRLKQNIATGYSMNGQRPQAPWEVVWEGAGTLRSTPADMLKFLQANLDTKAIGRLGQAMQLAQQPFFKAKENLTLGLAWQLSHHEGLLLIDKNGAVPGFSTYIGFLPEKQIGVALFCNQRIKVITALGRKILEELAFPSMHP